MKYPTPTSTRTYNDRNQRLAKTFFDAEFRAERLAPTPREMTTVLAAAVSIFAYKAEKGRRSPFPSPEAFVDHHFGIDEEDPALRDEAAARSTLMLKLAWKIYQELEEQVKSGATDEVLVTCPDCQRDMVDCHIGTLPCFKNGRLIPDVEPKLVALFLHCECRGLGTAHFDQIEKEALLKWRIV